MKKYIFLLICFNVIFISNIAAIDYSNIFFSDDITINDDNIIKISLPIDYRNNNNKIEYQFIETTVEKIDEFETLGKRLIQELIEYHSECNNIETLDNETKNECLTFLEYANNTLYSSIPEFDEQKWIIKDLSNYDSNYAYYEINNTLEKYNWIWIKATDKDGNDIYQISSIKPNINLDVIVTNTNEEENSKEIKNNDIIEVPNTKKTNSDLVKLIGSCFVVAILAVLYIYFKNKEK